MMTIACLLTLSAFVCAIASAAGRVPLWIAVVLLSLVQLLHCMPLR